MPLWGLTEGQRLSRPWNLDPDLLLPAKTVTDPVHGDIHVTELEKRLLDSRPMQRLRRVRQLGTTHLVYPGATHSRFSHALGALRASQDLLDAAVQNGSGPRPAPDLFADWSGASRDRRTAEAVVLARLGALLHDFCHVPLGHTIEDDLDVLVAHDANAPRFERLWGELPEPLRMTVEDARTADPPHPDRDTALISELRMLILSKERRDRGRGHQEAPDPARESQYPFVADIVGNTICADLLDYIRRDHLHTGLPLAIGTRFSNDFYVAPSSDKNFAERMVVRIARSGHKRADIVSELIKYLRYRYELSERVLTHHAKVSADAMVGKLLEMWRDELWLKRVAVDRAGLAAEPGSRQADDLRKAVADLRRTENGQDPLPDDVSPDEVDKDPAVQDLDEKVRETLENEFVGRSDDGLLEYLAGIEGQARSSRLHAIGDLAGKVLNRELFKVVGRAEGPSSVALAEETHARLGRARDRRTIEQKAARYAGLQQGWQVVVWVPSPRMRLKPADVLVDNGDAINRLRSIEPDGENVADRHRELWAVTVYADAAIKDEPRRVDALLSYLRDEIALKVVRHDGGAVLPLREFVVRRVCELAPDRPGDKAERELVAAVPSESSGAGTYPEDFGNVWRTAQGMRLIDTASAPPDPFAE